MFYIQAGNLHIPCHTVLITEVVHWYSGLKIYKTTHNAQNQKA